MLILASYRDRIDLACPLLSERDSDQTRRKEVMIMRANGRVVRGHEIPSLSEVWEAMRAWVRSTLTPKREVEAAFAAGTLLLIGYFAFVTYPGSQNLTFSGLGESLSLALAHLAPSHPLLP